MHKIANLSKRHNNELRNWKEEIGPKTSMNMQDNLIQSEKLDVQQFFFGEFLVYFGRVQLQVNILHRHCTCLAWD